MQSLILLFARYGSAIVFVVLEFLCFYLIINYNQSQKEIWIHSANLFSGSVNKRIDNVYSYVELQDQNDSLLQVNADLLQEIINFRIYDLDNSFQSFEKTIDTFSYELIPATIKAKTIHLRNNFLTINKGTLDSIYPGMGVISENGIVGIVKNSSDNFSQILQLLNGQTRISSIIKDKNYPGELVWKGSNAQIMNLDLIPKHAKVEVGDTVLTSGYSTAFPFGIPIGKISNYYLPEGDNEFEIEVSLFNNIASLNHVYGIKYELKEEKSLILAPENEQ